MSEQSNGAFILDGYIIGTPIQSRFGVSCSPALKKSNDQKYIVKAIKIPQSQTQLDALLITGAYRDAASAKSYFRMQADEVVSEAGTLNELSRKNGFSPFQSWQLVPDGDQLPGFEVFLLSPFQKSLQSILSERSITHLDAINLAIDMCAALTCCRKEGFLYVNLKPSNIFYSDKLGYQIGDLGFTALNSLKFYCLPQRYQSAYTAPEVCGDFAVVNETVDTYALGMILYQLFNDGELPEDKANLFPPRNGDLQIQRIIMKACDPDPAKRWKDPAQMGQVLVLYMQRNSINQTPLLSPLPVAEEAAEPAESILQANDASTAQEKLSENDQVLSGTPEEEQSNPEAVPEAETESVPEEPSPEPPEPSIETIAEQMIEEPPVREDTVPQAEASQSDSNDSAAAQAPELTDAEFAEIFSQESESQPTAEEMEDSDSHSEPETASDLTDTASKDFSKEEKKKPSNAAKPSTSSFKPKKKFRFLKKFLMTVMLIFCFSVIGMAAFVFYQNEYLLPIEGLSLSGTPEQLTVAVQSDIEDTLLTVNCSDPYGTVLSEPVINGYAVFDGLTPGAMYTVTVQVSGLHKLTGAYQDIYSAPAATIVTAFSITEASDPGSALLNITAAGSEPSGWTLIYQTGEEEMQQISFSGHTTTISNLTADLEYHFRLETADGTPLIGQTEQVFVYSQPILAQWLTARLTSDDCLVLSWAAPANASEVNWSVRCCGDDYDQSIITAETQALFQGIVSGSTYTVEVAAEGMTAAAKAMIPANPISIADPFFDNSAPDTLVFTWDHTGAAQSGWIITYTVDGAGTPAVIRTGIPFVTISPKIPGAAYHFSIQTADNAYVQSGEIDYKCPKAELFMDHKISSYGLTAKLLATPADHDWSFQNLTNDSYSAAFIPGQDISMVLRATSNFRLEDAPVVLTYVIRDEAGQAHLEFCRTETANWAGIWSELDYHYAQFHIGGAPEATGKYTFELYMDGKLAVKAPFSVT